MEGAAGQGTSFHTSRPWKEFFFLVEYNLGVLRDADLPINLVEIWFLHNSCGYWEFPWKDNSQVVDVKHVFMGPCTPGVILDSSVYNLSFSKIYFIKNSVDML